MGRTGIIRHTASNLNKHGIDFVEAQKLWYDPDLIEIKARCDNEPRFLIVAKIKKKYWSAIITYRKDKIKNNICKALWKNGDCSLE